MHSSGDEKGCHKDPSIRLCPRTGLLVLLTLARVDILGSAFLKQ